MCIKEVTKKYITIGFNCYEDATDDKDMIFSFWQNTLENDEIKQFDHFKQTKVISR